MMEKKTVEAELGIGALAELTGSPVPTIRCDEEIGQIPTALNCANWSAA